MKEIKSWKRSCSPCIVLLCPLNLLFRIFYRWKNFHVLWKIFIFGGKNFRDFLFYYIRRQKLSRKWAKIAKIAKFSALKVFYLRFLTFFTKESIIMNIERNLCFVLQTKNSVKKINSVKANFDFFIRKKVFSPWI